MFEACVSQNQLSFQWAKINSVEMRGRRDWNVRFSKINVSLDLTRLTVMGFN